MGDVYIVIRQKAVLHGMCIIIIIKAAAGIGDRHLRLY